MNIYDGGKCEIPDFFMEEGEYERNVFSNLSALDQANLLKLLALISECSYRRGYQQGAFVMDEHPETLNGDLDEWRYGNSLIDAPNPDGRNLKRTSMEILDIEYQTVLDRIGLHNAITAVRC